MASSAPLRIGVLGAARIVPDALIAPAKTVEGVAVTAIAARDPNRAREFAATHGIARVLGGYQDLVRDPEIDAVYNPLPNALHCEWTIRALAAGKHVLCEKPFAANADEAERMVRAADGTGLVLAEAAHYRYHPLAARVRQLVRELGRLQSLEAKFSVPFPSAEDIRFDWALAGGATMDLGFYPLQMLRYFSGEEPRVVRAAAKVGPPLIDVAMAADLELPSGASAKMSCSMEPDAPLWVSFEARGEGGELSVFNPLAPQFGHRITVRKGGAETQETVEGETTYAHQLRAFVAAVRGGPPMPTDGREGVANMRLIDSVYRAAGLPLRGTA